MTRFSKIILILAIVVAIGIGIVQTLKSTAHWGNWWNTDRRDYITQSFGETAEPIQKIEVDWLAGQVYISYGNVEHICWQEEAKDSITNVLCSSIENGVLHLCFDAQKVRNSGGHNVKADKNLKITLPMNSTYEEIEVVNVNGEVIVHADAETISTELVNGNTTIQTDQAHSISTESVNGAQTIYLPAKVAFDAEMEKLNGNIHIDFPFTKKEDHYIVGSAPYVEIEMEAINGNLSILPSTKEYSLTL